MKKQDLLNMIDDRVNSLEVLKVYEVRFRENIDSETIKDIIEKKSVEEIEDENFDLEDYLHNLISDDYSNMYDKNSKGKWVYNYNAEDDYDLIHVETSMDECEYETY